jgi:hypothetical protein
MSRGVTCTVQGASTPHMSCRVSYTHAHPFLFSQIQNFLGAEFLITKKNIVKSQKRPLNSNLIFFYFKSIFIFLLFILIVYYFLYLCNTKVLCVFKYNSQETIVKIQKYPLIPGLIFLLPMVFGSFYYAIKMRKYLFFPAFFGNNK